MIRNACRAPTALLHRVSVANLDGWRGAWLLAAVVMLGALGSPAVAAGQDAPSERDTIEDRPPGGITVPTVPPLPDFASRVISHDSRHTGADLMSVPGKAVRSPIAGTVVRLETAETRSGWRGLVLRGAAGPGEITLRLLGIEPALGAGAAVAVGDVIGIAQDPADDLPGITPYVHLEVYIDGRQTEPMPWLELHWPEHRINNSIQTPQDQRWPYQRFVAEANERLRAGNTDGALTAFHRALRLPDWEIGNSSLHSMIAHVHAVAGRFPEAVEAQLEYIRLMRLEYAFAEGSLPDPELGIIAAVNTTTSLGVLLGRAMVDLEGYRAGFIGGYGDFVDP